jgi:uncharacterized protein involved in response to NO
MSDQTRPDRLKFTGPALLSFGFRPFFLLAGLFAVLAIGAWLPEYEGEIRIRTAFSAVAWHAHEMLYGYLAAAATGFLLTAIPNWTGRLPFRGPPLAWLAGLWVAGRIAVSTLQATGWLLAMLVDCSFLLVVFAVILREVLAGRNFKNLKVVVLVSILLVGNITFHLEAHLTGAAAVGIRVGLAGMMLLVMVIGGRIIPSFTRNWLARRPEGRMPIAFNRFDVAAIIVSAIALASWVVRPDAKATGALLAAAGCVQLVRLARWAGERTFADRLVLVLHVAYLFVPAGFLLLAAAEFSGIPQSAGIHAWTIGGMTTLTLAVMTRATLGHTGRALSAGRATELTYGLIVAAAALRIAAALVPAQAFLLVHLSALAWLLGFVAFVATYGPMLLRPKVA